jgi:hypothetical protein
MLLFPSVDLVLAGEFTSLEEPTEVFHATADAILLADRPGGIESERRREPRDPTRKLKLPTIRSISWSSLAKIGARVGGCG